MSKIVLKDGTEIQNALVGKTMNLLELTMAKADAVTNMPKFMDENAMSEIEFHFGAWKTVYTGFSRFSHMENPRADEMRVWMEGNDQSTVGEKIPLFDSMYMPEGA